MALAQERKMAQSRIASLLEALVNILVGFLVALAAQLVVFPLFGIQASFGTNVKITCCFTLVSLARQYVIRRWFNGRLISIGRKSGVDL